jgi:thioredoxin reductase (NADPH)
MPTFDADTIVIGGGPGGLSAAIYLGRFHRACIVIDENASRARWIPRSHNIMGFPQGITGPALLSQLRTHAQQYGVQFHQGAVHDIASHEGGFVAQLSEATLRARCVVMATGVQDKLPDLPGAVEALRRGVMRVCPICDAHEATGKRIAVIGDGAHAEREAQFLKTYSSAVTLLHIGVPYEPERRHRLEACEIELIQTSVSCLTVEGDELRVRAPAGVLRRFDVFYSALGCLPRNKLARALGAACDDSGQLIVSSHQETTVAGLYAVGDVVRGLNQIVVAGAEGALAATHIHNRLRNA